MLLSVVVALILAPATPVYRGADASFLPQYRDLNVRFSNGNKAGDALEILASNGVNLLRLRLWNEPADGYCGLDRTIAMAKDAKRLGMKVLLDFHYADSWADPQQQPTPKAWAGLEATALAKRLEAFTYESLRAMSKAGAKPDCVQIGNEVRNGMCWPLGKIENGRYDTFCELLRAGIRGARRFDRTMPVMIHYDQGGDAKSSGAFYRELQKRKLDFDWIGLSYYPWWHGTLAALQGNLTQLNRDFAKPIMIVETAYPWTLKWNDNTNNFVGEARQLEKGLDASPEGQAGFLRAVKQAMATLPLGRNLGLCWWAPEYIAAKGIESPYENLTLFNFEGRALPGLAELGRK